MGRVLVQQPGTNTAKALTETLPKNVIIVDEDLKELRLHDGVTPGGKIIGQSAGSGVPIGTIIPFAGNSVPQGYLLCDGSAISRTDYASLFAVIGTIYGAGDGNSTFNLPNKNTIHVAGVPDLYNFEIIPKTNLSTTNTPFTVDKDGLLLVQMASYGGALEEFMIDDVMMNALVNSFTTYNGWSVGTIPIRKGTHYMRTSTIPNRTHQIVFFPYKNTNLTEIKAIKYI